MTGVDYPGGEDVAGSGRDESGFDGVAIAAGQLGDQHVRVSWPSRVGPAFALNVLGSTVASIVDALEVELDPDKRKSVWKQAQQLYATDLPSLPLYFRSDAFILPKWLTGLRPTGNQYPSTLWVTDWGVQQ